MIRVAWQIANSSEWIGGLNYFINLARAVGSLPDARIEVVALGSTKGLPAPLNSLQGIHMPPLTRVTRLWDAFGRHYLQNGGMTGRFLRQNRIGLLSHGSVLGRRSPVPALCWIPDFQHVHRPEFFSAEEIAMRDRYFADGAADAQGILLSSADAAADFARLFPRHAHKARILRFVADSHPATAEEQQAVLGKYDIHEPFFHVPNQLWIHKNHGVVLEALKTLKSRGKVPLVISTGRTNDYRHPEYFPAFKKEVEEAGLAERFRFLGLAPYEDVRALMTAAVAFVNPSFFEGWSTTVEEAKSLGKKILLSGIGVHKEQAPERGVFFDPEDGAALADAMAECLAAYDPQAEMRAREAAQAALPGRMRAFGREYEKIVLDMASGKEKP